MLSRFLRHMASEGLIRRVYLPDRFNTAQSIACRLPHPVVSNIDRNNVNGSGSDNRCRFHEIHSLPPSQPSNSTPTSLSSFSEHGIPNWRISNPRDSSIHHPADSANQSRSDTHSNKADADALHFRRLLRSFFRILRDVDRLPFDRPLPPSLPLRQLQQAYDLLSLPSRHAALSFLSEELQVDQSHVRHLASRYLSLTTSIEGTESDAAACNDAITAATTEAAATAPSNAAAAPSDVTAASTIAAANVGSAPAAGDVDGADAADGEGRQGTASGVLSRNLHESRQRLEHALRRALTPPAVTAVRAIAGQQGGLQFVVRLRTDLHSAMKSSPSPSLRALDAVLRDHISLALTPSFLSLHRVTWDDPASLLERIVAYEAVHPVRSLLDLRRRLGHGRRCFAFFHPSMPGEPLVFIEVALTVSVPSSIQRLLEGEGVVSNEEDASTAIFYSISITQDGLLGIDLGHTLIKQVVQSFKRDMPHIQNFVTLSPIPGFISWLLPQLSRIADSQPFTPTPQQQRLAAIANHVHPTNIVQDHDETTTTTTPKSFSSSSSSSSPQPSFPPPPHLLSSAEVDALLRIHPHLVAAGIAHTSAEGAKSLNPVDILRVDRLDGAEGEQDTWHARSRVACSSLRYVLSDPAVLARCFRSQEVEMTLKPILMRLCAWYLVKQKRRGAPLDPTAKFHIRNGASVQRLNWLADVSPRGLARSAGIMVNYLYSRENERDETRDSDVQVGPSVKQLL